MKIPYNFLGVEQLASEYREYFISQQILPGDFPRSLEKTNKTTRWFNSWPLDSQTNVGLVTFTTTSEFGSRFYTLTIPLKGHVEFADLPGVDGASFLEKEHFHFSVIMAI